jgi:hypothetical protein
MPWALRCEAKSGVAWDDPIPLFGAALWRGMNRVQQPQLTLNPASRSDV